MSRLLIILLLSLASLAPAAEKPADVDFQAITQELVSKGDAALAAYQPENGVDTGDRFSDLYFDVFEASGMEMAIGLKQPRQKSRLESLFSSVIGAASRGLPREQVAGHWQNLKSALQETTRHLSGQPATSGFWSVLLQAFFILLREGFEAMLVITALVTYLRRQQANEQLPVIYWGVGLALIASLATAWLLQVVFKISGGATQEALEGITMLVAAGVLFYVSYWLISKSESLRWQQWIQGQINKALSRGSLFALGLAAFLAVYREGAETVLFYQALAGQVEGQWLALLLGISGAALALLGMYWIMRKASLRLPLGLFFGVTAGLLYYLAISFAGNGVLELQAAGWISITPLDNIPRIGWLGLHPTRETLMAQLLLLLPLPFALWWWLKQRKPQPEAAQ
ncbi:FTR1 family iron permease [Thiolapillus brandeum]|uniref:High-affinity iron transporter component 2 n=1 Tax=Thiolapillus brandeum TaxID=1076588 RepID=A0A7U6GHJ8_9GAMM|nr:FTR1 family protein [Thiolapillus brandeum]BAO43755.1 high-affinity iron transporter component 2 [Thiolapillus brandeum]